MTNRILDVLAITGATMRLHTNRAPLVEISISRRDGRAKVRVTRTEDVNGSARLRQRDATDYMAWEQIEPVVLALLQEAGYEAPAAEPELAGQTGAVFE